MSVTFYTNLGILKIELECIKCPMSCENFLVLCASGYYNNTIFHRNIPEFIVQGGDPTGTGKGGKAIYEGGRFNDEIDDSLIHNGRGIVSYANSGKNSNGSQFFISYAEQESLDQSYTLFGRLIDGFETLNRMENIENDQNDRPKTEIKILRTKIHANPFAQGLIEAPSVKNNLKILVESKMKPTSSDDKNKEKI